MGLLFIPFILIVTTIAAHAPNAQHPFPAFFGGVFALLAPVMYGVMGFILGVVSAAVYNVAARFVGGFEVEVE